MKKREYYYEIIENGYYIKDRNDETLVIYQPEPYIPYPNLGYEGSAKKQIEDMIKRDEEDAKMEAEAESEREFMKNLPNKLAALKEENERIKAINSEHDDMLFEQSYEIAMLKLNSANAV